MSEEYPAPLVRPCDPDELIVTDAMRAEVFWCLRRYSSLAYANRAAELLRGFLGGFEAWARQAPPARTGFSRQVLKTMYAYLAAFEEAPGELLGNRASRGYDALERAAFLCEIEGPAFDGGGPWFEFGYGGRVRPSTGLYAWAERAVDMATRIRFTVRAEWAYTRILSEGPPEAFRPRRFPPGLEPLPAPHGPTIATGEVVPITGVWVPVHVANGCPNFLVANNRAPELTVEAQRVDTAAWPGSPEEPARPATVEYVHATRPTSWRLAWEDIRYRAGVEPDESEFLDEDNALPAWRPVHPLPS
ncbi:Imm72 family immunity protein [Nannocystis radixulma]|uniref:Imm72 family immunity protein n=1 Tax=Nannocystis radixulma TaxID=2995305 RepID=A0ABT5BJ36_9BACT|nr:Imm72 family immunity protein [Nannocystis radixulma]MDC0674169.1 Imm72 family immunity protein [Nannocystis radixulma]